jgi:hypothetical protein
MGACRKQSSIRSKWSKSKVVRTYGINIVSQMDLIQLATAFPIKALCAICPLIKNEIAFK